MVTEQILRINCKANGALKWKNIISQQKELLYTTSHLTNVVVYGVLNATSHLFGQGYLYLTDAQIIKKVLVGPVPRAST